MPFLFFLADTGSSLLNYIAAIDSLKEQVIKNYNNTNVEC